MLSKSKEHLGKVPHGSRFAVIVRSSGAPEPRSDHNENNPEALQLERNSTPEAALQKSGLGQEERDMDPVLGNDSRVRRIFSGAFGLWAAGLATVVFGQAAPAEFSEQRLDRVDVIEARGASNVAIDIDVQSVSKPWVAMDYAAVSGMHFTACENTATRGMYCLDGNSIRHWPNPDKKPPLEPVDGRELFDCSNAAFAFDRISLCTGFAVDLDGNFWLAGRRGWKASLVKVVAGACPSTPADTADSRWTAFTTTAGSFCAREYAAGRALLLTDLEVVDGDTATAFPRSLGHGGVIGIEDARVATFFPDAPQATPVTLIASKAVKWSFLETLQSVTLLQKPLPSDSRNWLLAVTSAGRLLSREIPWNAASTPVVNHSAPGGPIDLVSRYSCGLLARYDIRASATTRSTYVSDRRGGRLLSLQSNVATVQAGAPLAFTSQAEIASIRPASSQVATLSVPPEGVSVAPGVEVDLRADCGFDAGGQPRECGIVPDGGDPNFAAAASLKGVRIDDGTPGGLTVFQIQNIPDCRYLSFVAQPAECKNGAIVTAAGRVIDDPNDPQEYTPAGFPLKPESLFLNVAPLMPPEVTKVVTLPRMLISPRYRALSDTNTFDALFGVTDEGVRFRETFVGNFHLDDLIPGRKLGCGGERMIDAVNGPPLDIVLTISERYTTVGGLPGGGRQHADMLVNTFGCDPTDPPVAGTRWSLYAYGLQLAAERGPDTHHKGGSVVRYPDTIFAKLALSLFHDLGATIDDYLCFDRDGGSGAPVSATTCSSLRASWANTNDKLAKCIESSVKPMHSSGIRTCNAFETHYASFAALVNGLVRAEGSSDVANRVGEAKARLEVFRYVYDTQFKPSIPARGCVDGL